MDRDKVYKMVSALVKEVDYDIWKELYLSPDEFGMADQVDALNEIAWKYINEAG